MTFDPKSSQPIGPKRFNQETDSEQRRQEKNQTFGAASMAQRTGQSLITLPSQDEYQNYHTEPVQDLKLGYQSNEPINIDLIKREPVLNQPLTTQAYGSSSDTKQPDCNNAISFANSKNFDMQPQLTLAMMSEQYGIPEWMPKKKKDKNC